VSPFGRLDPAALDVVLATLLAEHPHEVLAAELAPEALHPNVAGELATQLADIRLVLAEAARLMTNDRLRQRYRSALPPPASGAAIAARVASEPSGNSQT